MTMGSWEEDSCWSPEDRDQTRTEKQLLANFSVTELDQEQAFSKRFQKSIALNENENVDNESENLDVDGGKKEEYPLRPYAEDCPFYLRTGYCKFGFHCKFNHPVKKGFQEKERGGFMEQPGQIQCKFYRSTGGCKHGEACRFNHTIEKSKIQPSELNDFGLPITLEKENSSEGFVEKTTQIECKYYLSAGGCKYGKTCKYSHTKSCKFVKKPAIAVPELNFLGLPIRVLEKECPFYMRNGSCAYGVNCKFHHPDPVATGGSDSTPTGVSLGGHSSGDYDGISKPLQLTKELEPALEFCSSNMISHNFVPHFDNLSSHAHWTHPDSKWSRPQGSIYQCPSSRSSHSVPAENNLMNAAKVSSYNQWQVEEFPERPGQPECSYFMKTGNCKYRSSCKFHHPKSTASKSSVFSP